jgi:hypothetical protein
MIESAQQVMQAASILGRQQGQVLGNQRLMLWYHLGRQRCALFSQTDQMRPPILRVRLPYDQPVTLHAIEQAHNVTFGYKQPVGQLLLDDGGRALELSQHVKLRRSQAILFKVRDKAPFNLIDDADQIQPCSNFSNQPLAHSSFLNKLV